MEFGVGDFDVMSVIGRRLLAYRRSDVDTSVCGVREIVLPIIFSSDMVEIHRAKCLQKLQLPIPGSRPP